VGNRHAKTPRLGEQFVSEPRIGLVVQSADFPALALAKVAALSPVLLAGNLTTKAHIRERSSPVYALQPRGRQPSNRLSAAQVHGLFSFCRKNKGIVTVACLTGKTPSNIAWGRSSTWPLYRSRHSFRPCVLNKQMRDVE